ncbi:hypothetical protein GWI33_016395 [Rhynchophorus ferrugineus]|uniref:Uncharacterized protein n=1 Tax=Rhynchophorus ferrugineus TaxID=354439 RepID=A0A834MAF2_RHYFE|nr:hypothetical protein GWI33_016395 [Rhynchophorus ferrugineus]
MGLCGVPFKAVFVHCVGGRVEPFVCVALHQEARRPPRRPTTIRDWFLFVNEESRGLGVVLIWSAANGQRKKVNKQKEDDDGGAE